MMRSYLKLYSNFPPDPLQLSLSLLTVKVHIEILIYKSYIGYNLTLNFFYFQTKMNLFSKIITSLQHPSTG
jgi:hypothetical protein